MSIILCYECESFVDYDDEPACEHTEDEATDTDLEGHDLNRAKLEALGTELDRDEPRVSRTMLQAEFTSLAARTPTPEENDE